MNERLKSPEISGGIRGKRFQVAQFFVQMSFVGPAGCSCGLMRNAFTSQEMLVKIFTEHGIGERLWRMRKGFLLHFGAL